MPFGAGWTRGHWTEVYEDLIRPAIDSAGVATRDGSPLTAFRADEEAAPGAITPEIVDYLAFSPAVVADLTEANANVYYELGVRHCLQSPTVVVRAAQSAKPSFDVQDVRYIEYEWPASEEARQRFFERMRNALAEALRFPDRPDSTVARVLEAYPDLAQRADAGGGWCEGSGLLRHERFRAQWECRHALLAIWEAFLLHATDHDECFPASDKWDEEIRPYLGLPRYGAAGRPTTRCPLSRVGRTGYRMNGNLSGWDRKAVRRPEAVPLVFDDSLDQGAMGGAPGSGRHPGGHNILFAGGNVRCVAPEELHRLRWEP